MNQTLLTDDERDDMEEELFRKELRRDYLLTARRGRKLSRVEAATLRTLSHQVYTLRLRLDRDLDAKFAELRATTL